MKSIFALLLLTSLFAAQAQDKFYAVNDDGINDVAFDIDIVDADSCTPPMNPGLNGGSLLNIGDQPGSSTTSFGVLAFDTANWGSGNFSLVLKNRFPNDPLPASLGKVIIEARNFDEQPGDRNSTARNNAYLDGYTEITRLNPADLFNPLGISLDSYVGNMLQDSSRGRYLYVRLRFETCTDNDNDYDTISISNGPSDEGRLYITGAGGAIQVDGTLAGSWYDPARDGEGFLLDIAPDNDGNPLLAAYYFTYKNDGSGEPLWIVGAGPISGSETTLSMITASGAHFGNAFNPSDVNRQAWGNITFKFVSCNQIDVSYDSSSYGTGSFSLQRIINVPVGATGVCAP